MVFKLVRTDSEEPCKIQLRLGKHLIGRGKFLDCDDKRVSRNHGELEVLEDTVTIKALHQNPCFIIRKETEETQILAQNSYVSLSNGDRFGLLPHSYWYELLHCTLPDDDQQLTSAVSETNEDVDSVATEPFEAEKDLSEDCNLNKTVTNDESPQSPSLITTETDDTAVPNSPLTEMNVEENGESSPLKRANSSNDSEFCSTMKKIKTEDETNVKQEPADTQGSNSSTAVNNQVNDQAGPSNSNNGDKDAANPPPPANPLKRERCMYGANCYRRNPQHKAQFSHPTDADWGAGERGECPWGAACRRRDPRHWRDHAHPPGLHPPHAGNKRKIQTKKHQISNDEDDDDDDDDIGNKSPILNKKRTRNTITYQNNWNDSNSEGEEDPYGTDDDDSEWQPSESQ